MSHRRASLGDRRVGELVNAGWLRVAPLEGAAGARLGASWPLFAVLPAPASARRFAPLGASHATPRLLAQEEDRVVTWAALAPDRAMASTAPQPRVSPDSFLAVGR
jgi:hypothetical protein